jgi:hypothetical protein
MTHDVPSVDQHLLIIPPVGIFEVLHTGRRVQVEETLRARVGFGTYVNADLRVDNEPVGRVHWFHDDALTANPRAREAVAMLTGAHMVFTGPVVFEGVEADTLYRIVADLSRKD